MAENSSVPVPVDLVTTSGSGLDPDISPGGAVFQVPRVAKARKMPEDRIRQLVMENTAGRFGLFGELRVNVLELDATSSKIRKTGCDDAVWPNSAAIPNNTRRRKPC